MRIIAHYLPQYHPIPENDKWWGKGFTEWVTTASARPLYKGHYQPRIPGQLGFYDLRLSETRNQQADLARMAGIHGFCYWHYWLGNNRRLLEKPFNSVLESNEPDYPFCLGWANHDWKGVFFGAQKQLLVKQEYPGKDDLKMHYACLERAFNDHRYIKIDGKPVFFIFDPRAIPECRKYLEELRKLSQAGGFPDLYIVGQSIHTNERQVYGLDGVNFGRHRDIELKSNIWRKRLKKILNRYRLPGGLRKYRYTQAMKYFMGEGKLSKYEHPSIVAGWDTTARFGREATILTDFTPENFRKHIREVFDKVKARGSSGQESMIFLKSWNEWAEGNYIEPDRKYGSRFLDVLREEIGKVSQS